MLIEVIKSKYIKGNQIYLHFNNGDSGLVDLTKYTARSGVFEPLKDNNYFKKVRFSRNLGTICWPNGADIAPESLYDEFLKQRKPMQLV